MTQVPVITIDGPAGSGKGTLSRLLAKALGWHFLDSGALYRILAYQAAHQGLALEDELGLADLARSLTVRFVGEAIWLNDQDIAQAIRSEQCGNAASRLSVFAGVRTALLQLQRSFWQAPGLVADGRDMGTEVFPQADLKIFLEANPEERARRRYEQLKGMGQNVTLVELLAELKARDIRDKQRVVAPLRPAEDAVVLDTSNMSIEAVYQRVWAEVLKCGWGLASQ